MNISDLGLLISFIVIVLEVLGLMVAILKRNWILAKRLALALGLYTGLYFLLLIGVALLSPQRVLVMHQVRCFDDWCVAVEQVAKIPEIGPLQAKGSFLLVTIDVFSQAKRIRQRALDAAVYLLDEEGNRYYPSPEGQQTLEAAGEAGLPLNSWLEVGNSFTHTAVFDLPTGAALPDLVFTHGAFPGLIIIGDDQSWLHKPTIVRLALP